MSESFLRIGLMRCEAYFIKKADVYFFSFICIKLERDNGLVQTK